MAELVGRQRELRVLRAAARGVESGRAGWVSVTGEAGIGKTRLLGELGVWARGQGFLVLAGRGAELERDVPLGIWVDALDDHLGALEPAAMHRLVAVAPDEMAAVFRRSALSAAACGAALPMIGTAPTAPSAGSWNRCRARGRCC